MSQIKTKFISDSQVTNAKLANMAANTVKANVTGGSAAPTDVAAVSAATASAFVVRDANANARLNALIPNFASTATAAGTTTLTVSSAFVQQFTGSTTQTVVLPDATTLVVGQQFFVTNRSSGVVQVNANGGGAIQTMVAGSQVLLTVTAIGTSAGSWDSAYSTTSAGGGGTGTAITKSITQTSHGFSVGNVLYYTGSAYALAKADVDSTSEALGLVSAVADANTFSLTTLGYVTGLSGLTSGQVSYLSDTSAGALTTTQPTTAGHVSKPMLVADSTTTGWVIQSRGVDASSGGGGGTVTRWSALAGVTYVGLGTVSGNSVFYRQVGDSWQIRGYVTAGTVTGTPLAIVLPSGTTMNTAVIPTGAGGSLVDGVLVVLPTGATSSMYTSVARAEVFYDGSTNDRLFIAYRTGSSAFTKENASNIAQTGQPLTFTFTVPITGL